MLYTTSSMRQRVPVEFCRNELRGSNSVSRDTSPRGQGSQQKVPPTVNGSPVKNAQKKWPVMGEPAELAMDKGPVGRGKPPIRHIFREVKISCLVYEPAHATIVPNAIPRSGAGSIAMRRAGSMGLGPVRGCRFCK